MTLIDLDCDNCIHKREKISNECFPCDAFPEGIPLDYYIYDRSDKKECNNGIGFVKKESDE